jgi:hypothetical protein
MDGGSDSFPPKRAGNAGRRRLLPRVVKAECSETSRLREPLAGQQYSPGTPTISQAAGLEPVTPPFDTVYEYVLMEKDDLREERRQHRRGTVELADRILELTSASLPTEIPFTGKTTESAWEFWNAGFMVAGYRLFRAVLSLVNEGLTREAELPTRSLLELVANQHYMDADKETRVADFTHQASAARERLGNRVKEYGLGEDLDWEAISAGIDEEQQKLTEELGGPSPGLYGAIRPFDRSARDRIEGAGMQWHYDLFYATASDMVHMSAKAVDWFMDWGEHGLSLRAGPDPDGAGVLTVASEFMLRLLYKADKALGSGHEGEIDVLAEEYWRLNRKKGLELETLIRAFRGEGVTGSA